MSPEIIAAGVAIALLAALCQTVSGFGFALVMTPLLVLVWDVKSTVATSVLLGTLINIPLLHELPRARSLGRIPGMLLGFVLGLGPGILLLERLDPNALRVLVAGVVIVASILMYSAPTLAGSDDRITYRVAAGVASGVIGASTGLSGPPVVLYLVGREPDAASFRTTLLVYFLVASSLRLATFVVLGQITADVIAMSVAALPAITLGLAAGVWLRRRLDLRRFRGVVLAILIATGAAAFAGAAARLT